MLIKIVRAIAQKQLDAARAGEAHSKSELHLLQSQISPHFLFNTLNNMYGLSITQHEKLPPLLLKLSELLRYSVYDATELYVPLKDEMAYINNYIEFEKIRIGDRLMLTTAFEDNINAEIKIAPMLLIVFIENAFKHSKNTTDDKIFIEITLRTWANKILFTVKNSQAKSTEKNTVGDKNRGFGLSSVYKRLELLYPGEHELSIENGAAFYNVMLQLKMK
jgi:LytS/YehU family sensor histidine kinase